MAVVDELVARIGFDVKGQDNLKRAAAQYKKFQDELKSSAGVKAAAAAQAKLAEASVKTSAKFAGLTTIARGVGVAVLGIATAAASAGAGVGLLGALLARAGANAARLRRELQIESGARGTTARNSETMTALWRVLGANKEKAGEINKGLTGKISDALESAKRGDMGGVDALRKGGIQVGGKGGRFRDSTAIAYDAMDQYVSNRNKIDELRKKGDAAEAKKKGSGKLSYDRADAAQKKNETFAEVAGITAEIRQFLKEVKNTKDLKEKAGQAGRLFPGWTDKQEEDAKRLAASLNEVSTKWNALIDGIKDRLNELGAAITSAIVGPINAFLDALVAFAKNVGWIKETQDEKTERETKNKKEAEQNTSDLSKMDTPGAARKRSTGDIAEQLERLRRGSEVQGPPMPKPPQQSPGGGIGSWLRTVLGINEAKGSELGPKLDAINSGVQALQSTFDPVKNLNAIMRDREVNQTTNEYDQRQYSDIGTDKRTISISTTVNATGLAEVGALVNRQVSAALAKSANTSTGALDKP